jgi:hypothetical protein
MGLSSQHDYLQIDSISAARESAYQIRSAADVERYIQGFSVGDQARDARSSRREEQRYLRAWRVDEKGHIQMKNTTIHRVNTMIIVAALTAGTCGPSGSTRADVINAAWSSSTQFIYEVNHMPDLDQRREFAPGIVGLPGDGGMYCVPTSVVNLFAYAANHGFPLTAPGPGWWQLPNRYNDASEAIATLGVLMSTDPNDGTGGNGAIFGTSIWLAANGNILTADYHHASGSYSPTINSLGWAGVNGGIVAFCYGRYDVLGVEGNTVIVGDRNGGHCVTLANVARSGSSMVIASRDPADDPDSDEWDFKRTQSLFGDNVYDVTNVNAFHLNPLWSRTMTALNWDPNNHDGRIRLIDSYLVIKPRFGITFVNTGGPDSVLELLFPEGWFNPPPATQFNWGQNTALLDAILAPDDDCFFVIAEGAIGQPNLLQLFDIDTQIATEIMPIPNATGLLLGRKRQIYILAGDRVHCLDTTIEEPELVTIEPPFPIADIAFDDRTDQLVALSTESQLVMVYGESLQEDPMTFELPGIAELSGDGSVVVSPLDGRIWMVSEANDLVYGFLPDANGEPPLVIVNNPSIQDPTDVSVTDDNHVLVTTEGQIIELEKITDTAWRPVLDSSFAGIEVGERFQIARSRTNFNPQDHPMEQWRNVDPDELAQIGTYVADCPGDFDDNGLVDVNDVLYMLSVWDTDDPLADIAPRGLGDGLVDVNDLLELIAAWGPCP